MKTQYLHAMKTGDFDAPYQSDADKLHKSLMSIKSQLDDSIENVTSAHIDKYEADHDLALPNQKADKMHASIKRCLSKFISSWKPSESLTESRKLSRIQIRSLVRTIIRESNLRKETEDREKEEVEKLANDALVFFIKSKFGLKQVKGFSKDKFENQKKRLASDILKFLSTDGYFSHCDK